MGSIIEGIQSDSSDGDLNYAIRIVNESWTIKDVIDAFLKNIEYRLLRKELTANTLKTYKYMTAEFLEFLQCKEYENKRIYFINKDLVTYFLETKNLSPGTHNKYIGYINTILTFAYDQNMTPLHFRVQDSQEQIREEPKYLTDEQISAVISAAQIIPNGFTYKFAITILAETGCTMVELLNLSAVQINLEKNIIALIANGKSKDRTIEMTERLQQAMEDYLFIYNKHWKTKNSGPLLVTDTNRPIIDRSLQNAVQKAFEICKIEGHSLRSFRDTFAINKILYGASLENVIQYLGTSSTESASRYLVYCQRYFPDLMGVLQE